MRQVVFQSLGKRSTLSGMDLGSATPGKASKSASALNSRAVCEGTSCVGSVPI